MEFRGFANSDFDFFKKKTKMTKEEYELKREEVKKHFREFCYQLQKDYYSIIGKVLILDKDFQGLNKNKSSISAICKIDETAFLNLYIILEQDYIRVNLFSPQEAVISSFEQIKSLLLIKKDIFTAFFKQNKNFFIILYKKNNKKSGDAKWEEQLRFTNNELSYGNFDLLIKNMEKLQPVNNTNKNIGGICIRAQYSKVDAIKIGKGLTMRVCDEIIKISNLCSNLK